MKIERISDNQIRCTLTREDLAERQIKLSELAYGTEKAKKLFQEMMQQANYEFGFDAEDIPLMIEAIPMSAESIILVITKVEYPDELDTRFSRFSEPDPEDVYDQTQAAGGEPQAPKGADDILGFVKKLREEAEKIKEIAKAEAAKQTEEGQEKVRDQEQPEKVEITRMFTFDDMTELASLSKVLSGFYTGSNSLYRGDEKCYYLVVNKNDQSPEEFNKVCNILSEYGKQQSYTDAKGAYFEEHLRPIIKENAINTLAEI